MWTLPPMADALLVLLFIHFFTSIQFIGAQSLHPLTICSFHHLLPFFFYANRQTYPTKKGIINGPASSSIVFHIYYYTNKRDMHAFLWLLISKQIILRCFTSYSWFIDLETNQYYNTCIIILIRCSIESVSLSSHYWNTFLSSKPMGLSFWNQYQLP